MWQRDFGQWRATVAEDGHHPFAVPYDAAAARPNRQSCDARRLCTMLCARLRFRLTQPGIDVMCRRPPFIPLIRTNKSKGRRKVTTHNRV